MQSIGKVTGSIPVFSTDKASTFVLAFFMQFKVYILYSPSINQYYVGHTQNIEDRLYRHNNSGSKSTKKANDWKVVYTETCLDKSSAFKRELEIKKKKSRKFIETLIKK